MLSNKWPRALSGTKGALVSAWRCEEGRTGAAGSQALWTELHTGMCPATLNSAHGC